MNGWLAYSGAFACALAVGFVCYLAGFMYIMGSVKSSLAHLIVFAVAMPALAALATFGLTYMAFAKRRLSLQNWCYALAFVAVTTGLSVAFILLDLLEEGPASLFMVGVLFFGGRMMLGRLADA